MKRTVVVVMMVTVLTGCVGYNNSATTSPGSASTPVTTGVAATTSIETKVTAAPLKLGKAYSLGNLDLVFRNLYRSRDKAGRDGLLVEYTKHFRSDSAQTGLPQLELEILQGGQNLRGGGDPPGHELVDYRMVDLLPGATLQVLAFYEAGPEEDLELRLTLPASGQRLRLTASYPLQPVDLKALAERLGTEREAFNATYRKEHLEKVDLSLVGQTVQFDLAKVQLTEVKTVPNDIIGGRDLIVTYTYRLDPALKGEPLNIQIQAFQYGIEVARQFIDEDALDGDGDQKIADFIVNFRDNDPLVIRLFDPKLQKELVFKED